MSDPPTLLLTGQGDLKGLAMQAKQTNKAILLAVLAIIMAGCTIDERGMRDPVAEAKAAATRQAASTLADKASVKIEIDRKSALAEIKLRETQAEAAAYKARAQADIDMETARALAAEKARVLTAFSTGMSGIMLGLSACAVLWTGTRAVIALLYASRDAGYVKIGVEPSTLLPPPLVIVDGYLLDTRSGERAKLRDPAGVNRLKLAASTRNTETAQLARAAVDIGKATKDKQAADMLPAIAQSVPTLEIEGGVE